MNESDDNENEEPERIDVRRMIWFMIAVVVLLPFLYVLSVGPMAYASSKGWVSNEIMQSVYQPLERLYDNSPVCKEMLDVYFVFLGNLFG